jgi:uncharacterized protein YcbX
MPTLTELNFYPVKSCGGIGLREAIVTTAGLMSGHIYDREWMVVDANGQFLTQREFPKMALIKPRLTTDMLELRAPGMLRLDIPLDLPDPDTAQTINVQVWEDSVQAYDCDDTTAAWFSNALGTVCRLVRFHPDAKRIVNPRQTGAVEVLSLFSDGYPLLVISEGSLDDLNTRLLAGGRGALPMNRFRPNIVIKGIGAFEEDHAESIKAGNVVIRPVKPCPRCPVPSIDQATGQIGPDPLDILQTYRAHPKIGGAIAFGMNAILAAGHGQALRVGQEVEVCLAF